jgi:hypothetical protein
MLYVEYLKIPIQLTLDVKNYEKLFASIAHCGLDYCSWF